MLEDALEHLVRGIVDHPDDVVVRVRNARPNNNAGRRNHREVKTFEVTVNQIGRAHV